MRKYTIPNLFIVIFEYIISGFVVGTLVGLTGVGGGSLMTPLLVLFFKFPTAVAVGTDLLYAAITKSAGAVSHHRLTINSPNSSVILAGFNI